MPVLIKTHNLEKFYETGYGRTYVLRRVNIEIEQGEFVTFMGPSGAGKSTLLHILGMLDGSWDGEYEFAGHPVHRMKPKQRNALHKEHVGFVFQSYHLLDDLTVYENLEVPLSYRKIKRGERQSMVCDVLDDPVVGGVEPVGDDDQLHALVLLDVHAAVRHVGDGQGVALCDARDLVLHGAVVGVDVDVQLAGRLFQRHG